MKLVARRRRWKKNSTSFLLVLLFLFLAAAVVPSDSTNTCPNNPDEIAGTKKFYKKYRESSYTFSQAKQACTSDGLALATFTEQAEADRVFQIVNSAGVKCFTALWNPNEEDCDSKSDCAQELAWDPVYTPSIGNTVANFFSGGLVGSEDKQFMILESGKKATGADSGTSDKCAICMCTESSTPTPAPPPPPPPPGFSGYPPVDCPTSGLDSSQLESAEPVGSVTYYATKGKTDWSGAEAACAAFGLGLVTVQTEEQYGALAQANNIDDAWIDLHNPGYSGSPDCNDQVGSSCPAGIQPVDSLLNPIPIAHWNKVKIKDNNKECIKVKHDGNGLKMENEKCSSNKIAGCFCSSPSPSGCPMASAPPGNHDGDTNIVTVPPDATLRFAYIEGGNFF